MSTKSKLLNKKVVIIAALAVGVLSAVLIASSVAQARAEQHMMWRDEGLPQINGSVNVADEAKAFFKENAKVPFITAAETAQKQVTNGTVLGGHIGVVQGYLVYTFFVANTANQTGYLTIIDAGNGEVLYTSEDRPFGSFGHSMYGNWGGHGYGGWHAPWKGHGGMWH